MRVTVLISAAIVFLLFSACSKDPLTDHTDQMQGSWKHYTSETDYHVIYIYADGMGKLEWYNEKGLTKETKEREWKIKDNRIYFGNAAFNGEFYDITDYPSLTGAEILNGHDTIPAGGRYCQLDKSYYLDIQ